MDPAGNQRILCELQGSAGVPRALAARSARAMAERAEERTEQSPDTGKSDGSALPRSTLGMGVSHPTALKGAERNGDTVPSVPRAEGGTGALHAPPLGNCSLGERQGRRDRSDEDCASRQAARPHCGHARSPLAGGRGRASLPAR